MTTLWLIPFLIQMPLILFDEWFFHRKRGLPKWEKIGHPLDTLSVVLCLSIPSLFPYSPAFLNLYIILSVISCLMVTKDEWVHKHHCPAAEHWIHAMLFLNHPILLTAAGFLWISSLSWVTHFLQIQWLLAIFFMFYQTIYWNFYVNDQ
ncbi:MAG: hypothetical protein KGZ39_03245 [Simkania sp.]|nr:hypothetical protein [Simkania sp.]